MELKVLEKACESWNPIAFDPVVRVSEIVVVATTIAVIAIAIWRLRAPVVPRESLQMQQRRTGDLWLTAAFVSAVYGVGVSLVCRGYWAFSRLSPSVPK